MGRARGRIRRWCRRRLLANEVGGLVGGSFVRHWIGIFILLFYTWQRIFIVKAEEGYLDCGRAYLPRLLTPQAFGNVYCGTFTPSYGLAACS